jgi:hypothetical protein
MLAVLLLCAIALVLLGDYHLMKERLLLFIKQPCWPLSSARRSFELSRSDADNIVEHKNGVFRPKDSLRIVSCSVSFPPLAGV